MKVIFTLLVLLPYLQAHCSTYRSFNKPKPQISIETYNKKVLLGNSYQANITITGLPKRATINSITVDDQEIHVIENVGAYKVYPSLPKVKPNELGFYTVNYTVTVSIQLKKGRPPIILSKDTTYLLTKPKVFITSETEKLYLRCGNKLSIKIPQRSSNKNIVYQVVGGSYRRGKTSEEIIIIPDDNKVILTILSNGIVLKNHTFRVQLIPWPEVFVSYRGKKITQIHAVNKLPTQIIIKAFADDNFKSLLPKDARYRVTKWSISVIRKGKKISETKTYRMPQGQFEDLTSNIKIGDILLITVDKVLRRGYLGENFLVRMPSVTIKLPVVK